MAEAATQARRRNRILTAFAAAMPPLLYGVRLATAVSLALFVAFYLQLETPYWAGTTAAIVCQPVVGSTLLKGLFRLIGSAIGAVAAVLLTMAFPQERVGFLFCMLVWAGACSFVATLLRNFAAYAAMLAGYTLIIIAGTSIAAPGHVFDIAINRASEICIGIVAGTLVIGLTDLGNAPQRLSGLLAPLITEIAAHLSRVLTSKFSSQQESSAIRRALIARAAALDPLIDQAAGESPELLQRRALLRAATNGLFDALSGARIVETHLQNLPAREAAETAHTILEKLPPDWRAAAAGPADAIVSALDRESNLRVVRGLLALRTTDLSLRLTADGAADVASSLAVAANGLALLRDPARAQHVPPNFTFVVADYLPALINALRVFFGVGAVVLFWLVSAWPSGPQAIIFATITIMVFSPLQGRSVRGAIGQSVGTGISAILAGIFKFGLLVNRDSFLAFALVISIGLIPLGALSSLPLAAPFFVPATLNFVPMLAPTNHMTFDTITFLNTAFGLLVGCAAGGTALVLIPHLPAKIASQRLVDLSLHDLRRLAADTRDWTLREWQSRMYARLIAMPETAEPILRSYLVAALSVGIQVIRLKRLSKHGRIGAELTQVHMSLAAGDLAKLRQALSTLNNDIAAIPDKVPGAHGRLRARAALLAIEETVNRQSEFFEGRPDELR